MLYFLSYVIIIYHFILFIKLVKVFHRCTHVKGLKVHPHPPGTYQMRNFSVISHNPLNGFTLINFKFTNKRKFRFLLLLSSPHAVIGYPFLNRNHKSDNQLCINVIRKLFYIKKRYI